jgi:hypothetical protein
MSASDKAARARARMEQVRREMSERRALRARNGRAAHDRAQEALRKQGPVMGQVVKHLGELGRRRRQAGGWATEKTERDKNYVMGFGGEEEQGEQFAYRPAARRADVPPGGIGALDDDEVAAEPPEPEPPVVEPPAAPRRPAHAAPDDEDDDDFSSRSSWMHR